MLPPYVRVRCGPRSINAIIGTATTTTTKTSPCKCRGPCEAAAATSAAVAAASSDGYAPNEPLSPYPFGRRLFLLTAWTPFPSPLIPIFSFRLHRRTFHLDLLSFYLFFPSPPLPNSNVPLPEPPEALRSLLTLALSFSRSLNFTFLLCFFSFRPSLAHLLRYLRTLRFPIFVSFALRFHISLFTFTPHSP